MTSTTRQCVNLALHSCGDRKICAVGSSSEPLQGFDMQRHLSLMGLSLLLALSACGFSSTQKIAPDFKQNPHPKHAYEITLTIDNAPGPFALVEGVMQFDVVTPKCLPPPNANGGMPWPVPVHHIPIAWTRISDSEYKGLVYIDGIVDEDYYGNGVCRWELIEARADMKATGLKGETRFMPSIEPGKLKAQQAEITYFAKINYVRDKDTVLENPLSFGQTARLKMAHLRDDELFTVTLTPKSTTP
jgi:hypothetical protein